MNFPIFAGLGVLTYLFINSESKASEIVITENDDFFKYDDLFKKYGAKAGVPWWVLKVISRIESNIGRDPLVKAGKVSSDKLSWGLMQIAPSKLNVKNLGYNGPTTPAELNKPEVSIDIASRLVSELWKVYKGNIEWVIKGYNQGQGNTDKEKAGKIAGYADEYYNKFVKYKAEIEKKHNTKFA